MNDSTDEILGRLRRIETKLTRSLMEDGDDTYGKLPHYDDMAQRVVVPSVDCSIKRCIEALPNNIDTAAVTTQDGSVIALLVRP